MYAVCDGAQNTKRRDRIVQRAREQRLAQVECGEVRGHAGLQRADVVAVQHLRAAERRDLERFARGHCVGPETDPLQQQRLAYLGHHLRAVVRC